MDYSKIIAVSGLQGLHELVSSKTDGAIVRSLDDKTSRFVSSRIHNFSHLESIEIYTVRNNVNLAEILDAMQKSNTALPDVKDNAAIKKYFETVYSELDFERVYASDMKKIIKWFEVLKNNNVEIKLPEPVEEEVPVVVEEKPPVIKKEVAAVKEVKVEKPPEEKPKTPVKAVAKKKEVEAAPKEKAPKKPAKTVATKTTKAKKEEPKKDAPKKKAAPKKKK